MTADMRSARAPAVGVLMARYRIDRHAALRLLRNHARSSERKLKAVFALTV